MNTVLSLLSGLTCIGLATSSISTQKGEDCLLVPEDYKSNNIPHSTEEGEIFTVNVDIEVWAITDISLQKQHIEVDLRIGVYWIDYRIELVPNITSNRTWLALSKNDKQSIWKPTFFFRNCKGCPPLSFGDKSNSEIYVEKSTATLYGKHWVLDRFTCDIDLRAYPMDIQTCPIQLYIYEETYDMMRVNHTFPEEPGSVLSNLTLSEFIVAPIRKTSCTFTEQEETYDCLEIEIKLEHLLIFHLMTSYSTTSFIVVVSWISFWLPVELAPARVALGLTSLLTLATRLDQVQKDLPPVAYVKAIDIWVFACIFLVCSSLCEFAISHFLSHLAKTDPESTTTNTEVESKGAKIARRQRKNIITTKIQVRPYVIRKEVMVFAPRALSKKSSSRYGTTIDRISRVAFPLFFVFFNIVYWSYFLTYYN